MIQEGVTAGRLLQHPLETRLAAVIETVLSTYFGAFDDDDTATAELYVQKAAQQYQPSNIPLPLLKMMTKRTWTSQRPGEADSVHRCSKRSFHGLMGLDSSV